MTDSALYRTILVGSAVCGAIGLAAKEDRAVGGMCPEQRCWATRRTIRAMFEIPHRQLDRLTREGWVRVVKFGERRQSGRRYRVDDVAETLDALAAGRTPRRRA